MYEVALDFLKEIVDEGYEAYLVGGFPRDHYLHIETDDMDICTNMTPAVMKTMFTVLSSFDQMGSMKILYHNYIFEVTTFRRDGIYEDKRRPKTVEFISSLKEDLKRRDFVMNTLCIDHNGNYVDLLGARKDIDRHLIRCVGNSYEKLTEDPLRMIRALRFSVNLGFQLDANIEKVITEHHSLITLISTFRFQTEMDRIKDLPAFLKLCDHFQIEIRDQINKSCYNSCSKRWLDVC